MVLTECERLKPVHNPNVRRDDFCLTMNCSKLPVIWWLSVYLPGLYRYIYLISGCPNDLNFKYSLFLNLKNNNNLNINIYMCRILIFLHQNRLRFFIFNVDLILTTSLIKLTISFNTYDLSWNSFEASQYL